MSDWTLGYVADIGYTYGYYAELNPLRAALAFAGAGLVAPTSGTACELGFGQGLSANIHAAASYSEWHGTDFNPAQASFARELAAASGARAHLRDDAFADFCARADLPDFDFIGLHGIWSWISDENRAVIVDFIRRKLKVGGVLYISYNTLPGWASFAPMRHLMTEHAEVLGTQGRGIVNRIDGALDFAERLLALNPTYAQANPQAAERLARIKGMSREYLAHEYFNKDWHPMHFATMAQWLEPAKLQYACSANYLDHVEAINLSSAQQAFLNDIPDPVFRQTVRDFMVNQQFRKDYWVKGLRTATALEQAEAARQLRVVLTTHRADVPMKVAGSLGEANLAEAVYGPLLDVLADHRIRSVQEIEAALAGRVSFGQILQALFVLGGGGHVYLAQDDSVREQARLSAERLNLQVMRRSRGSNDLSYLASPVTGGGIGLNRFQQLFLLAIKGGASSSEALVDYAWQVLSTQNQKIVRDGATLETEADNRAELGRYAQDFLNKLLPVLKSLGVA